MNQQNKSYQQDLVFIQKAKQNKQAFALLYNKYWDPVYLYIFKKVKSLDDAGDICQSTMLKAMLNLPKYQDRGFPFSAWLYRIAANEVNLFYRRKKKDGFVEIQEQDLKSFMTEINWNGSHNEDEQDQVIKILNGLKPEQLELIEMRFFFHYSFKEIADIYKIKEATAKMKVYRILEKIKQNY